MKQINEIIKIIKDQWFYFRYIRPTIPKSIIQTYKEHKSFIESKEVEFIFGFHWDKYMPLNSLRDTDNPNYKDRLYVNHYRLWSYLGDYMLYTKYGDISFPDFKNNYFKQFNLGPLFSNKIPKKQCYLCELFCSNKKCDKKCVQLWTKFSDYVFCNSYCVNSYYGVLYNFLTRHQKALICYMIASLPIKYMETDFYKNHLLADTSEEKIKQAYENKSNGIFEPEPLFKNFSKEVR